MRNIILNLRDIFFQPDVSYPEPNKEEESKKVRRYSVYAPCLIASLTAFSILAYNSYKYSVKPKSIEEIPLIRKDITPLRIKPEDPGGERFLNQDKLIYNDLIKSSTPNTGYNKKKKPEKVAGNSVKNKEVKSPFDLIDNDANN